MTKRSPLMVVILSIITLGIYMLYWVVVTKREMNSQGAQIPTAWLILIPFVNIYWQWKFSEGVETVTRKEMSAPIAFILSYLLSYIGFAITQSTLNKVAS